MPFIPPRIGEGTDFALAWCGGSNVTTEHSVRPNTTLARRPDDFKNVSTVERAATSGLPEGRQLSAIEEKSPISLTSWVNTLSIFLEEHELDTVFRVYNPTTEYEVYLLDTWGQASIVDARNRCARLRVGVQAAVDDGNGVFTWEDPTDVDPATPCNYDVDNLAWSGKAILARISLDLWESTGKEVGADADRPVVFTAIVRRLQQSSTSSIRALINRLKILKLSDHPGQDVESFRDVLIKLCRQIEGSGQASNDLADLVAATFLHTDVFDFRFTATGIHAEIDDDLTACTWRNVISSIKSWYRTLRDQGL